MFCYLQSCPHSLHHRLEEKLSEEYPILNIDENNYLKLEEDEPQVERGHPFFLVNLIANILAIPGKILLWNRHYHCNNVSEVTEEILKKYLEDNGLGHVKVRITQYAPIAEFRRFFKNPRTAIVTKIIGLLPMLAQTVFPAILLGSDYYNPLTDTLHIFSDEPAITLHEAAHAKDFARVSYPGLYTLVGMIPIINLIQEWRASDDAIEYLRAKKLTHYAAEAYKILFPALGSYCGSTIPWIFENLVSLALLFNAAGAAIFFSKAVIWLKTPLIKVASPFLQRLIPNTAKAICIGTGHIIGRFKAYRLNQKYKKSRTYHSFAPT